jgi:hypothetical protein
MLSFDLNLFINAIHCNREKCHVIRAQYGAIGDELQGRMPLAYAHIVQVLLDVVLWMYPFMVRAAYLNIV